jgi:hypothetical protein
MVKVPHYVSEINKCVLPKKEQTFVLKRLKINFRAC